MRTTLVIDDKLMRDALKATGARPRSEVVEFGLRTRLRLKRQEEIRRWRGRLEWQAGPEATR
jgi:Arc/MetJ family transcription regulator